MNTLINSNKEFGISMNNEEQTVQISLER